MLFAKDYGASPINTMDKVNYMPGGVYNPPGGNNYGNSYGSRYPYQGGPVNGPYPGMSGIGGIGGLGGILPQDLEAKTSLLLPIAGAALLGLEVRS